MNAFNEEDIDHPVYIVLMYYCPYTIFQKLPFSKSHFSEIHQEKYDYGTVLHSRSLKKCRENFENQLTNKNSLPENNLEL